MAKEESHNVSINSGENATDSAGEIHNPEGATISGRLQNVKKTQYKYPNYNWGR